MGDMEMERTLSRWGGGDTGAYAGALYSSLFIKLVSDGVFLWAAGCRALGKRATPFPALNKMALYV